MELVAHFDGAHSKTHGLAAAGAVVYDREGNELGTGFRILHAVTVPVAEHIALQVAIQTAAMHAQGGTAACSLTVLGDAELIVRQIDGRYRCTRADMAALRDLTHTLMRAWGSCTVLEFPKAGPKMKRRHNNWRADGVAGDALKDAIGAKLQIPGYKEGGE